jgi:hypothetical protein
VACRKEAQAKNLTREEFLRRQPEDSDLPRDALSEALVLFFLGRRLGGKMLPRLRQIDQSTSNSSPGNSAGSSDSTPGR